MEYIILREHFDHMIQCTKELQLSQYLFDRYRRHYEEVLLYCTENQLDIFTYQNAADFCKLKCPALKKFAVCETTKIAYTVAGYFMTGEFVWKPVTFTQYPVSGTYEELMAGFRLELLKNLSPGTVRVAMVIIRQFLYFLEQGKVTKAAQISTDDVINFIRREAPNHKGSMSKLLRTMRKFVCFLRDENIVDIDADRFLTTPGRYRQKALPCFTDDEIQAVFSQIDRTTAQGRRDYAIFLLSLRIGLRASDIARLKLTDINWNEKTIQIMQKKTKTSVLLPLPVDVGNAIADYILHSRKKTNNPYVFLRLNKPDLPAPIEPTSFNFSLRKYMEAAGLARTGWDGRSFHALRRTAGTRMVTAGVAVSTVAQVLGHTDIESSKRYIALDTKGLRECCLDLGAMHTRKEGLV